MSVYKELGAKLKNFISAKTEEVDDKVEAIDKHERYVNTDLDYGYFIMSNNQSNVTDIVLFDTKQSGNLETNNGLISLRAGKTYKISFRLYGKISGSRADYGLYNNTTSEYIISSTMAALSVSYTGDANTQDGFECVYSPKDDCEICVKYNNLVARDYFTDIFKENSYVLIEEINRQIVIDPVEHVNESQGIEDTPVGHIIAHMGTVAPKHYLICDGTEYNIADYPYLAQHIEDNFGSISYFGGDGETTFRVPDLRGEFLRGTGTGTRDSGSGAEVGQHQDATEHIGIGVHANSYLYINGTYNVNGGHTQRNPDYVKYLFTGGSDLAANTTHGSYSVPGDQKKARYYASRPTNTSVLYCIKYEPTYFMNTYNTNYMQPSLYSEEEKVVGCWIDGRPLYEKTIISTVPEATTTNNAAKVNIDIENINQVVKIESYCTDDTNWTFSSVWSDWNNGAVLLGVFYNKLENCLNVINKSNGYTNASLYTTIQYTKTTDEPNSFTNSILKESYIKLDSTCTDEELQQAISDMVEEINAEEVTPEVIDEPETEVTEGGQG